MYYILLRPSEDYYKQTNRIIGGDTIVNCTKRTCKFVSKQQIRNAVRYIIPLSLYHKTQANLFTVESAAAYVIYTVLSTNALTKQRLFLCANIWRPLYFYVCILMCEKFYVLFWKRCREVYKGLSPSSLALRSHRTRLGGEQTRSSRFAFKNKTNWGINNNNKKLLRWSSSSVRRSSRHRLTTRPTDRFVRSFVREWPTDWQYFARIQQQQKQHKIIQVQQLYNKNITRRSSTALQRPHRNKWIRSKRRT